MEKADRTIETKPAPVNLGKRMVTGSAWMVGMRISIRGLGLINTAILARLLVPEDFGLIAMAMLVVGVVQVFAFIGTDVSLIRRPDAGPAEFDTAWTLNVILGGVLSGVIMLLAYPTAAHFGDPRLIALMQTLGVVPLIGGLQNIGVVSFRKELDFHKEFRFEVAARFIGLFISISLALWLRSYWAMALAMVTQSVIATTLSYFLHPYRPRLSLASRATLLPDALWLFARNLAFSVRERVDQLFVGQMVGAQNLGSYFVPKSIATMLTAEMMQPLGRALLPGYAKLLQEPERMREMLLNTLTTVALLSVALGVGLMAVAEDFVMIVLGAKWTQSIPYLEMFALAGAFAGIQSMVAPFFAALGYMKTVAAYAWVQVMLFIVVLMSLSSQGDILLLAQSVVVLTLCTMIMGLYLIIHFTPVTLQQLLSALYRPLLSGILMFAAVKVLQPFMLDQVLIRLVLSVLVGAIVYAVSMMGLWRLSGSPNGFEKTVYAVLARKLGLASL